MLANFPAIRRIWSHDKTLDSLKVAIAFAGVLVYCFLTEHDDWLIGMLLGVIAAALAETPDRVIGRLKALVVTLVCFAVASFSVRLLFPYPWIFAPGLALSTFAFVMLGVLGERYATIAIASVILAIYTMLGISQHPTVSDAPFLQDSLLLLAGATGYGLVSLLAAAAFPNRPLRHTMGLLYTALGRYLELKSVLLEPVGGRDLKAQRVALAAQNGRVVGLMNRTRELLLLWAQISRPTRSSQRFLRWFFLAQDIHERASSAHHPYEALSTAFARSDILFRCQRLLALQAAACHRLAQAMHEDTTYEYGSQGANALAELHSALAHVQESGQQDSSLLNALADLVRNISTIEQGLASAANPDNLDVIADSTLRDTNPQTLAEGWRRLVQEFTPGSRRFRHALRLSVALTAGYALLHLLHLPQGYWVMLTTVFVCQPNFSTTWLRLGQRIGGTIVGLLVASVFISSFPHPLAQLALLVVAGVAFFVTRADKYSFATACITVLVLICFNQFGSSYAIVLPRLIDTILGCLLAVAAVSFILPDWQGKRLHGVMARTLTLSGEYLREIISQYRSGKRDDLPYRIARREAHNADAELSVTLTSMLQEPGRYRLSPEVAYRFLCASHTLLGYISALGAHREQIASLDNDSAIKAREAHLYAWLQAIAQALTNRCAVQNPEAPASGAEASTAGLSGAQARLMRQLGLIEAQIPELIELTNQFIDNSGRGATPAPTTQDSPQ